MKIKKVGIRALGLSVGMALSASAFAAQQPTATASPTDSDQQATSSVKRSAHTDLDDSNLVPYAPGSNNLAFDLGQVFLMGNLSDSYSDSIGGQIHYTYGVSELFGFDASAGYSSHSDGLFSMATLLLGVRTNLSYYDKLIPYSIFGLGFYKPSYSVENAAGTGQDTVSPVLFGMHLGFGVDLAVTNSVFFGASLTFHDAFGSDQTTPGGSTISTGGAFMSFLLHAGYTF